MSLVEVSIESLPQLRDAYKINWPEHILAYCFLNKMLKRFKERPEQRKAIRIYSINDEIGADATFVAVMLDYNILVPTLDTTFKNLKAVLKDINFDCPKKFICAKNIYRETIIDFIKNEELDILYDSVTTMVYLSYEDAIKLKYEVPDGLELRRLSTSDAEKINAVWPHKYQGSEQFISHIIEFNLSLGLYEVNSGDLVAWCHEHDIGSLFVLQVDDNHLRKGYGMIVTKALAKLIAQKRGHGVNANIVHGNFKSMRLFEKLSFKEIDKNSWILVRRRN